jgi:hypothetical protein
MVLGKQFMPTYLYKKFDYLHSSRRPSGSVARCAMASPQAKNSCHVIVMLISFLLCNISVVKSVRIDGINLMSILLCKLCYILLRER